MFHRLSALLLLIGSLTTAAAEDSPSSFAAEYVNQLRSMLYGAALLDPVTGREDKPARQIRLHRQMELHDWFVARDRNVSVATCKTDQDLQNFRDYPLTMADFDLLRLPAPERLRFIRQVMAGLNGIPAVFNQSLTALAAGDAKAEALLRQGCSRPVAIRCRAFNSGNTTIGALYLPSEQTIYINLNFLLEHPESFVDALDHELWHHLLVNPTPNQWADNLWWEGCTEFLAEQWRWHLGRLDAKLAADDAPIIDYPVQAGLISALYAAKPAAFIQAAAGSPPSDWPLTNAAEKLTARRPMLAQRLRQWGWKEDDGSPISLVILDKSPEKSISLRVADWVRRDKQLYRDLIHALTPEYMPPASSAESCLAPQLQKNLKKVRAFCKNPQVEFGKEE